MPRLMEEAGISSLCKSRISDVEWYKDNRLEASSQAAYLGRLSKLRKELLEQEKTHLSKTLRRLQENEDYLIQEQSSRQNSFVDSPRSTQSNKESLPDRHRRLLSEKQKLIDTRRHGPQQPQLKGLEGRSMTAQPQDATDAKLGEAEDALSWDALTTLVKQETERLPAEDQAVMKNMQPQQSIPNVGRRALKKPDLPIERPKREHSETFAMQISLHQKDSKGLYKGKKRRNLMAADKDEIDLSPHTFRFDLPTSAASEIRGRRAYHPGCGTPATPSSGIDPQKQMIKRYFQPRYIGFTPARVMYLQNDPYITKPFQDPPKPMLLSIPVQQEILAQHRRHLKHVNVMAEEERSFFKCLFCQNPSLTMIGIGLGQYIMTHVRPNTPVKKDDDHGIVIPQPTPVYDDFIGRVGEANSGCETRRTGLTVELPDVAMPTSNGQSTPNGTSGAATD